MKKKRVTSKSITGFTLVEMAVVTLISGLLFVVAAKLYSNETKKYKFNQTIDRIDITQQAINEYFFRFGRYPCPADPGLAPTHALYGRAQCRANIFAPNPPQAPNLVYTNFGSRDAGGGPDGALPPDGALDFVAIGVVPFVTLDEDTLNTPYTVADGFDSYGHVLSYAVTEYMTNDGTYSYTNPVKPRLGAVNVRDVNAQSVVTPDNSAHYVIYSHGETGEGAYNKQGTRLTNCFVPALLVTPPAGFNPGTPGMQVELENCDNNDAIFIQDLRSYANGDDFNDDVLRFGINMQSEIWRVSPLSPLNDTNYFNTNLGSISTGNAVPTSILYVSGTIRAQSEMRSDNRFCPLVYASVNDCLDPDFLAGDLLGGTGGDECAPGEVVTGIERNQLICAPLLAGPPNFLSYCSGGTFMTGFSLDALGDATPICAVVP